MALGDKFDPANPNFGAFLKNSGFKQVKLPGVGAGNYVFEGPDGYYMPNYQDVYTGAGENQSFDYRVGDPTSVSFLPYSSMSRNPDGSIKKTDGLLHYLLDANTGAKRESSINGADYGTDFGTFAKAAAVAMSLGAAAAAAGGASAAGGAGASGAGGAGAGAAGASGAAPSLTGLGMTGTVPAGMGYGSAATGSLAGYGGLGAGAGYGATFGGSMEALGAAGASGLGALSGAGADGVAEGGFGASGFDGAADGISLPGHELTHSAGEVGGLGGSAGGFGSALSNLFGGSGGAGGFNWGSLVGPAISAIGGAYSANAASNAADAQLQAAREAQAKLEPWYQAGGNALARLQEELGLGKNTGSANFGRSARDFGMADFQADPGYAFRQSEGEKALQRAASAQGGLGSGRFLKDAMAYNQGQASQEYSNAFNRFQTARTNRLNPLQSLAGQGQSTAQMVGDLSTQAGNAVAAGKVGSANALTNALTQGFSMYQGQKQSDQNQLFQNALMARWANGG